VQGQTPVGNARAWLQPAGLACGCERAGLLPPAKKSGRLRACTTGLAQIVNTHLHALQINASNLQYKKELRSSMGTFMPI
jgi:hypothetical protein